MSGKIIYVPQSTHRCEGKPAPGRHAPGTLWACDDCGAKWVVVIAGYQYDEPYYAWRPLTLRNASGRDV